MFKNKIAIKLSIYFAIALLVFSLIIGSIFLFLLKNHTVDLHKSQLSERAESIAATLSGYMNRNYGMGHGMMGYGAYFQFIGDIAGTDVWVVDKDLNLITSGMGHGMMGGGYIYNYSDLPENADNLIKDVFTGQTVLSEDFSGLFLESTLTVGAPIKNGADSVIGAVLLHSPVKGINEAIGSGARLLAISLGIALVVAFLLSLLLSKSFTDPIITKEAQDALRLEKTRREFVANISHELKTPITVIRGSLEALIEKVVTDPVQVEDYQKQMLNEATFLQRLVGDLLDLSKLQNTDFVFEKQVVSMNDILEDVIRSVTLSARKKGISVNIARDGSSCIIYGDYGRIRQMLMIVLDNAVKFSKENGKIDIMLKENVFSVCDYGIGIPEEDLPFIFDRFHKSRSEQNKQGTGLGLAIAKQIAQRHSIELSVRSIEGVKTEFIFKMP